MKEQIKMLKKGPRDVSASRGVQEPKPGHITEVQAPYNKYKLSNDHVKESFEVANAAPMTLTSSAPAKSAEVALALQAVDGQLHVRVSADEVYNEDCDVWAVWAAAHKIDAL